MRTTCHSADGGAGKVVTVLLPFSACYVDLGIEAFEQTFGSAASPMGHRALFSLYHFCVGFFCVTKALVFAFTFFIRKGKGYGRERYSNITERGGGKCLKREEKAKESKGGKERKGQAEGICIRC